MFNRFAIAAAVLLTLVGVVATAASQSASAAPRLVAAFGKANIGGQELIVHTVSVVPPGQSYRDVANAALAAQGARPITSSEFSTTGLAWTDGGPTDVTAGDGVAEPIFNYNPQNDSLGGLSEAEILAGLTGWNGITPNFAFSAGPHTDRCPSLVRECPGRQITDGKNDFGWLLVKDKNTLAVTWYNVGAKEADVAFSTRHAWYIAGQTAGDYDIQTVALHEFGHGLGLGHSEVNGAVMEPFYSEVIHVPQADDIAGVLAIYDPQQPPPAPTLGPGGEITDLQSGGVDYSLSGRHGRDLVIEVTAHDNNDSPVSGAQVTIQVFLDGTLYGTGGPSLTGDNGTVRWRVRRASSGLWTTTVVSIEKDGISCGTCPDSSDPGFVKP